MAPLEMDESNNRSGKRRKINVDNVSIIGSESEKINEVDESDYRVAEDIFNMVLHIPLPLVLINKTTAIFKCRAEDIYRRICKLMIPKLDRPIPESILQLHSLEELYVNCTKIDELPRWFGRLTSVKTLTISLKFGGYLPEEISELPNLEVLNVSSSGKKLIFPRSFGNLTNLKCVSVESYVDHVAFPASMGSLTNLKTIRLQTHHFPEEICDFSNLEYLSVHGNCIEELPTSIGSLKNLKELTTQISGYEGSMASENIVPNEIGDLTSLETLNLGYSNIASLPRSIGNLKNLKTLYLHFSEITTLPDEIGCLTNLKDVDLRCHTLSTLPPTILNLKNLEHFHIIDESLLEDFSQLQIEMLSKNLHCHMFSPRRR